MTAGVASTRLIVTELGRRGLPAVREGGHEAAQQQRSKQNERDASAADALLGGSTRRGEEPHAARYAAMRLAGTSRTRPGGGKALCCQLWPIRCVAALA